MVIITNAALLAPKGDTEMAKMSLDALGFMDKAHERTAALSAMPAALRREALAASNYSTHVHIW